VNEERLGWTKRGKGIINPALVPSKSAEDSPYLFFIVAISGELGGETSSLYAVAFG
jgi:hypothetical protein